MAFSFARILIPVNFDGNSIAALEVAAQMACQNDGTLLLLHVVPTVVAPTGMPLYVDLYKR
ncbi:MAG: universal stress protein [Candidatus Binataceae bacterium]